MQTKIDYEEIIRVVVNKIGFDSDVDDLSSVDSKCLCHKTCKALMCIDEQSPDIAGGVRVENDDLDVDVEEQGIVQGCTSDETEDCMPLTHSMNTCLVKKLTDVRKSSLFRQLRQDCKIHNSPFASHCMIIDLSIGCDFIQ